jgi:hypothetical protein
MFGVAIRCLVKRRARMESENAILSFERTPEFDMQKELKQTKFIIKHTQNE